MTKKWMISINMTMEIAPPDFLKIVKCGCRTGSKQKTAPDGNRLCVGTCAPAVEMYHARTANRSVVLNRDRSNIFQLLLLSVVLT